MNCGSSGDRLVRLLPHWAVHAREHAAELSGWRARAEGQVDAAALAALHEAESRMTEASAALEAALAILAPALPVDC